MRLISSLFLALPATLLYARIALAQTGALPANFLWSHAAPAQTFGATPFKDRRIVDALRAGEVHVPFQSDYLLKAPPAAMVTLGGEASQTYLALDCLRWVPTPRDEAQDAFVLYPDLAERTLNGTFGRPREGKFASPFNPVVRAELVRLVGEMADKFPRVNGLVLRCELPWGAPLLGYSEAARSDTMTALGFDPANVILGSDAPEQHNNAESWIAWRRLRVTQLVDEMASAWKKKRPNGKVAVVGYAGWDALKNGKRNTLLSDWPAWVQSSSVDEVMLEDVWRAADTPTLLQAITTAQQEGKKASLVVSADQIDGEAVAAVTARTLATLPALGIVLESENNLDAKQLQDWNNALTAARANPAPKPIIAIPDAGAVPLQVGDSAPDFSTADDNGRAWNLAQWRGQRNVLLTFFPKCFTGQCEQHLESLRAVRDELAAANVEVVAVSTDDAATQVRFSDVLGLDFTLLPDTNRKISQLYKAINGDQERATRQSVLIDREGKIRWIDKNVNVTRHGEDVLAQVQSLKLSP